MTVLISRAVSEAIRREAAESPDREVCGLLFGTTQQIEACLPTANVSPHPARAFEIDPVALFSAQRAERGGGPTLVGYYHSHPQGPALPSETDSAMAVRDSRLWLIIAGDVMTAWRAAPEGFLHLALQVID